MNCLNGVVERDARPPIFLLLKDSLSFLLFYFFTFLLLNRFFTLKYCYPVKIFSYGFREAGPLCETHCKPQSGAAVGGE